MVNSKDYTLGILAGAGCTHIGDAIHYYTSGNMQEAGNMAAISLFWFAPLICYGIIHACVKIGIKMDDLETKIEKD